MRESEKEGDNEREIPDCVISALQYAVTSHRGPGTRAVAGPALARRCRGSSQQPVQPAAPCQTVGQVDLGGGVLWGCEAKASVTHALQRLTMRCNRKRRERAADPHVCQLLLANPRQLRPHDLCARERRSGQGRTRKAPGTVRRARTSSSKNLTLTRSVVHHAGDPLDHCRRLRD